MRSKPPSPISLERQRTSTKYEGGTKEGHHSPLPSYRNREESRITFSVSSKPNTRCNLHVRIFSRLSARVSILLKPPDSRQSGTDLCLSTPTPQGPSERLISLAVMVGASRLAAFFFFQSIRIGDVLFVSFPPLLFPQQIPPTSARCKLRNCTFCPPQLT